MIDHTLTLKSKFDGTNYWLSCSCDWLVCLGVGVDLEDLIDVADEHLNDVYPRYADVLEKRRTKFCSKHRTP